MATDNRLKEMTAAAAAAITLTRKKDEPATKNITTTTPTTTTPTTTPTPATTTATTPAGHSLMPSMDATWKPKLGCNNFRLQLAANLHALVKRRSGQNERAARKQLVVAAGQQQPQPPLAGWLLVALIFLSTAALMLPLTSLQAEAKIHHSKRQVPPSALATQEAGAPTSAFQSGTGRESTNWWNVWWQRKFSPATNHSLQLAGPPHLLRNNSPEHPPISPQPPTEYITEAAQPTVRPIVAVTFNGRSINLSDHQQQQPDDDQDSPAAPAVQVKSARHVAAQQQQPDAASLEDTNVFVDKQMLLAHRKQMMQHQMHWQSVKPTIIQTDLAAPVQTMRDARTNRQVNSLTSGSDGSDGSNLGIQMRASMNSNSNKPQAGKPSLQRSSGASRTVNSPAQNLFQQQQQQQMTMEELGGKFEQQQNQMVDYSEENDEDMPEMDEMSGVRQMMASGNNDETSGAGRVDSSSSSMMQPETKPGNRVSPGMRQTDTAVNQVQGKPREGPRTIIMMGMGPQSIMPQVVSGGSSAPRTTTTTAAMSTTTPATITTTSSAGTTATTEETGSSDVGRQQVMSTRSSVPPPPPPSTTTLAPTTTTTTSSSPTTTTTTRPTTTLADSGSSSSSQVSKTTPATSRVQLENGRPATGLNKQQATTNAARPPTIATPSRGETMPPATTTTTTLPSTTTTTSGSTKSAQTTTTTSSPMDTTTLRPTTSGTTRGEQATSSSPGARTTQSSLPEPTTTTLRPSMSANDTAEASGEDSDGDDSEDEEVGSEQGSGAGSGNSTSLANNSSNEETSGDGEEDEEEDATVDPELSNTTTTTSATPVNMPTSGSARQQQQPTSGVGSMMAFTTQQPSMTTIDIERLPKGGATSPSTTTAAAAASTTTAPPTTTTTSSSTSGGSSSGTISPLLNMTPEDINRIRTSMAGSGGQLASQEPSANVVMMTIGQNNRQNMDEDMAITMPMETLMKMMNQVVQENETRLQAGSSPSMSSMADESTTTTTTTAPPTTTTTTAGASSPVAQTTQATSAAPTTTTTGSSGATQESTTTERPSTTNSMSGADEDGMMSTMGDDQMLPLMGRKKLPGPPPPTPRTETQKVASPGGGQTSFIDGSSSMGMANQVESNNNKMPAMDMSMTSPAAPQKETMFSMMEPVALNEDSIMSMNGQREPKIELLNLDLMPIQRIMNNQQMMSQMSTPSKPRERLTAPQEVAITNNNRQVAPAGESQTNNQQMEQVVIADVVEPGMRLKPIKSMNQQRQQQQQQSRDSSPIIMSDMMSNKNKANTVYMIMMNGNSAGDSSLGNRWQQQQQPTMTTKSAPPSTGSRQVVTKIPADQDGQTMMMIQREQSRTTSPARPSSTGTRNNLQQTMTTQPAQMSTSGATKSSSTPGSGSTLQQQQQMMMIQMSMLNQAPTTVTSTTTTTTTARPPPPMDFDTMRQQQLATQTTQTTQTTPQPSTTSGATSSPAVRQTSTTTSTTTTKQDTMMSSPQDMGSSSSQPMTTARDQQREDVQRGTTTTTPIPTQSTTPVSTSVTASTTSTTSMPDNNQFGFVLGNRERGSGKLDKLQQQQQQVMQQQPEGGRRNQGTKSGGSRVNKINTNNSASFIPNKLRNDFQKQATHNSRQHVAQASSRQNQIMEVSTTTQLPLTGMAIRQFGGANRMSVLGQQPVPFGRPAAMTMPARSSSSQSGGSGSAEQPTFEYGPSIAVRRPDEPLANGQVPNCTLTGKNFCVLTKDYPMNEVRQAVERSFRSVRIMYEELQTVSDQELHKDDFNATNNQAASGKFACQTQVEMMRPGWAKDEITKEWMLVVNTDVFPQRVRTESCAQPNTPCEFIAPFYDSTCQQRYSLHRMIAIDPHDPSRSPQVAVFRFPAGCVCRVHPIRKTQPNSATTPSTTSASTSSSSSRLMSRRRRR